MQETTFGSALRASAKAFADHPAIIADGYRISFSELDARVDSLAMGLLDLGIQKGDHVALWLPNSAEWIVLFCACARIGAVIIPVNTRYKSEEVKDILVRSDAKLLVMAPRAWGVDRYDMLLTIVPSIRGQVSGSLNLPELSLLKSIVVTGEEEHPGARRLLDIFRQSKMPLSNEAEVKPTDTLLICYTSGTTGRPKGVMHNHTVIKQARKVGERMRVTAGDRILGHMPFFHVGGLFMTIVPALVLGAAIVPMEKWDADAALDLIAKEKVTAFVGIPTLYYDLVSSNERLKRNTSSLKVGTIGGAAIMQATFERIMARLELPKMLATYGMTENTLCTTLSNWNDPVEIASQNAAPVLADCEVKIVDVETKNDLPVGQEGEIWCRGSTVMMGYYKDIKATNDTITPEGWLKTGDLGYFDGNGYLTLTGRLKDLMKIGGTNTSPMEIEQYLCRHPSVLSCVVVGVPHERLDEVPFAFVIPRQGKSLSEDEVVAFCRDGLASYKVPRYVKFMNDFPRTDSGKVEKRELAAMARVEAVMMNERV